MPLTTSEFNRLVDDHSDVLYRIAYRLLGDRHEAEDLVQDTYRCAWKSRASFDAERGDRSWLVAILRRRYVDRCRRIAQPRTASGEQSFEAQTPATDPFQLEYTDEMQAALGELPTELRETLLLVVVGELTHQEAATLLNIPLGTVLSRVSRARARLRECLMSRRTENH